MHIHIHMHIDIHIHIHMTQFKILVTKHDFFSVKTPISFRKVLKGEFLFRMVAKASSLQKMYSLGMSK